ELDFVREAENMRRFAEKLASAEGRSYAVPKVYDGLTAKTVLTMEFIRGRRLSEITDPGECREVAANIARASFEQLFEDGLFHADPHPGNAFILPDARIALIDFGSVGEISYAMRETLVVLVVAVGLRDADSAARLLYRVGVPETQVSLHRLRDACASLFDKYLGDRSTIANIQAAQLLRELFDLAARFRIRIPSEYVLVGRASITAEGIIRSLDPELDVLDVCKPFVKKLVDEQLALSELGDVAMRNLVRARSLVRDLPLSASQVLMDLEAGKLRIQIENSKLDTIARNIDALGVIVFMGLVACGLIVGSLVYLSRYEFRLFGVPVLPTVGLYIASILFGATLGRYLLSPRLRKVSIGRWLARRKRRLS
ncbi:MAG: AarF/ABC1/UbiB kinase family protein, partial [Clostridia bacterium]|nr:AarF/ABC1/UbiB kinase family protein [Deltaproteobacteria bacterium]